MPPNTFPQTAITLSSLTEYDTPALLDLRPILGMLSGQSGEILGIAFTRIQQAVDNLQQTLRANSPSLQYLQIDSADIAVLAVGSQYGPGEFTVYNGGPDFASIGWIGSRAKSTTVNITNIVAGLVTAAAAHGLKIGDNVYIEATTDANNTGFYVVATTPLTTTFTVTGGVAGGNSTGGTMTKQFQGIWSKMAAFGGTAFDNAPFQVDVDGSLTIMDAMIEAVKVSGGITYSIILDPSIPSLTISAIGATYGPQTRLSDGIIQEFFVDTAGVVIEDSPATSLGAGVLTMTVTPIGNLATSKAIDILGYSTTTTFGPLLSLAQARGTHSTGSASQSGDTLGGVVMNGFDTAGVSGYAVGVRALATETFGPTAHGSEIIFETTPNGSITPATIMNITQNGYVGIGTSTPGVQIVAGRRYLTIKGSTLGGVAELVSAQADANGNIIGLVQASDINNVTDADVRPVAIQFALDGATANRRGGSLRFLTKADSGGLTTWETLDRAGNHGFGGNTAPAYPIDVTGDINASGVYRKAGTAGLASQVVALAKLTGLGANGSFTVTGGIVTAYTAPT